MKLNIGYFADGPWSFNAFNKLIKDPDITISFICGRFQTKDKTLKRYSKKYKIDYLEHKNINSKVFISKIAKYNCNLLVSMSFDQIFKKEIINLTKYKSINCHAGKLPFYRGRNILNWALINDEKEFGITVHYIDEKIDSGDIILQKSYKISDKDNYKSLLEKAHVGCANVLYDTILMFKNNQVKTIKQKSIHPVGFYCPIRKKGDEILNWNQSSREIFNFVRAICKPGPIARAFINKNQMKINKVELIENATKYKSIIGIILKINKNGFIVKTKDNFIRVTEFEFNGKIKVGDRFDIK